MSLERELELALDVARRAGQLALDMQTSLSVTHKENGLGPVTNADLALDKLICQEIQTCFPKDIIISEESYASNYYISNKHKERIWFIDPIDGTNSYIQQRADFVIMIGLAINGTARLGVIYQPTTNILWWGLADEKKAFKIDRYNSHKIVLQNRQKLTCESHIRLLVSRTSRSRKAHAFIDLVKPAQLISSSSFGLKAMIVASNEADLYICWARQIHLWDTCAPCAILTAAGGYLRLINQQLLYYDKAITHGQALIASQLELDAHLTSIITSLDN